MAASRIRKGAADSYQCGGVTKKGAQCRRQLRERALCYQHLEGSGNPYSQGFESARQNTAAPVRSAGAQAARARPSAQASKAAEATRVRALLDLYLELATAGWRATVADKLSSHLGDEIWGEIDRAWQTKDCKNIAEVARALEAVSGNFTKLVSALDEPSVKHAVSGSSLANALVNHVGAAQGQIDSVVLAMRVTGIVLCQTHGHLRSCQCLKDLADETVPTMLEAKLDQVCNSYLAHV